MDSVSISLRLYSWRGDLILFIIIPSIGVFCCLAIVAAFSVVFSVTWSGEETRNTLSDAAIIGLSSSWFGEVSNIMKSYLVLYF